VLPCPITAFRRSHDSEVSASQLREWRRHTAASFALKILPGGHFFLQTQAQALLGEIERRLGSAPSAVDAIA